MYYLKKQLELSSSHKLCLSYESKCENIHGHNWTVNIYCKRYKLNKDGMIIDFGKIKDLIMKFDHANLNDVLIDINPTAENLARYFWSLIPYCYRVEVEESKNNLVWYEKEKKECYGDD